MEKTTSIIETLQADVNLNRAAPEALAELAGHGRRVRFGRGEYVFQAGDDSDFFYVVESGRIILSKEAPSGKVFTYLIAVRGMTLNAVTCFLERPRFFSARVAQDATVIAIPGRVFKQWALANPEVATGILNTMGELLDGAYSRIIDIIDENAEKRIMNALTMLSSRIGLTLPLTNNDVAELTGVSRETAARTISRLQEAGLVSKARGSITILDKSQLEELSTSTSFFL